MAPEINEFEFDDGLFDPWDSDASKLRKDDFEKLKVSGNVDIGTFCLMSASRGRDESLRPRFDVTRAPSKTVLSGQRGLGKSFLLRVRSVHHRAIASRTLFYPASSKHRGLVESLTLLGADIPDRSLLRSADSAEEWSLIWQISLMGLMAWLWTPDAMTIPTLVKTFPGLEKLQDKDSDEDGSREEGRSLFVPPLQWFLGALVRLHASGNFESKDALAQLLGTAMTDWLPEIKKEMRRLAKKHLVVYIDNPDELVVTTEPDLWAHIQQGLLLAIWKLRKGGGLADELQIYASVRSEALLHKPHRDLIVARDLVMELAYDRSALRELFEARIGVTPEHHLVKPLTAGGDRVTSFIGFNTWIHEDRYDIHGRQQTEDVVDAIVRHTRMVPRDLVLMGKRIAQSSQSSRDRRSVHAAVNHVAGQITNWVAKNCFPSWTPSHESFLLNMKDSVISRTELREFPDGASRPILRSLVGLGLLGYSRRNLRMHRDGYEQRFLFDALPDAADVNADYFFVHPATKEWIRRHENYVHSPGSWQSRLLIGDGLPFEAKPPRVRLAVEDYSLVIYIDGRLATTRGARANDSTIFLFMALLAWKKRDGRQMSIKDLMDERDRLKVNHKELDIRFTCETKPNGRHLNRKFFEDLRKKLNKSASLPNSPLGLLRMPLDTVRQDKRVRGVISVTGSDLQESPVGITLLAIQPDDIGLDDSVASASLK